MLIRAYSYYMTTKTEPLISTKQVAEMTGLERRQVIAAALSGELEAYNFGGAGTGTRYRFAPAAVRKWMESRRVVAA